MVVGLLLDTLAIVLLVGTAATFLYILLVYFKGMERPPFWLYFFFGFLLIGFHGILQAIPEVAQEQIFLSVVRVLGFGSIFVGAVELLNSYMKRIKFDNKLKKRL